MKALALSSSIMLLAACGSEGAGAADRSDDVRTCNATAASSLEGNVTPASFKKDIAPILATSCSFRSCHGSKSESNALVLSKEPGQMRKALIEGKSRGDGKPFVVPSAPNDSWLLAKVQSATFCTPQCAGDACGDQMPKDGDPLEPAQVAAIQRWIAAGANDD